MRKLISSVIVVLMLAVTFTPTVHAKTLKEVLNEVTVENTARNVQEGVNTVIFKGPYTIVKWIMKGIAAPFYWLEKART